MQRIMCVAALSANLIVGTACDGDSKARLPAAPTPPPPPPLSGPELAGVYTLTVEADGKCVDLPQAVKKRTYQAALEATPYAYLAIYIAGGGYTQRTVVGELWNGMSIDWNNFDIGGCDGYKEPLGPSSSLMICGEGAAQAGESVITAQVSGKISVEEIVNGAVQQTSVCTGRHPFTFQRTASN
jgi:hypothetical protein